MIISCSSNNDICHFLFYICNDKQLQQGKLVLISSVQTLLVGEEPNPHFLLSSLIFRHRFSSKDFDQQPFIHNSMQFSLFILLTHP